MQNNDENPKTVDKTLEPAPLAPASCSPFSDDQLTIFSEWATPEQEEEEAILSLKTALSIARYENPEHRLVLSVSCGPLETFLGNNVPARFVGRMRRCVHPKQSPAKVQECPSDPTDAQKSQNNEMNDESPSNS